MSPPGDQRGGVADPPDPADAEHQEHPDSFDPGVETGYLRRGPRDHELPVEIGASPFDPGPERFDTRRARRAAKRKEKAEQKRQERAERQERERLQSERAEALKRDREKREQAEREQREREAKARSEAEGRRREAQLQRQREQRQLEERRKAERAQAERERMRHAEAERAEREREEKKRRAREQRELELMRKRDLATRERAEREKRKAVERERRAVAIKRAPEKAERPAPPKLKPAAAPRTEARPPKLTRVPPATSLRRPTAKAGLALAVVLAVATGLGSLLGLPVPVLGSDSDAPPSTAGSTALVGLDSGTPAGLTKGPYFPVVSDAPVGDGEEAAKFHADRGGRKHEGQDLFAKPGTPLVAVRDGIVLDGAGGTDFYSTGGGNEAVIYSPIDNRSYVYLHMLKPALVKAGDLVKAGQPVGQLGCTGSCDGPHLHFEIRIGRADFGVETKAIDPLPIIRQWPQRPAG